MDNAVQTTNPNDQDNGLTQDEASILAELKTLLPEEVDMTQVATLAISCLKAAGCPAEAWNEFLNTTETPVSDTDDARKAFMAGHQFGAIGIVVA